jgi:hypothetical protein
VDDATGGKNGSDLFSALSVHYSFWIHFRYVGFGSRLWTEQVFAAHIASARQGAGG